MKKEIVLVIGVLLLCYYAVAQPVLSGPDADTVKTNDPYKNTRAGNGFFKNKDYKQAEKKYRDALITDTADGISEHNLGNALFEQGKYDEAAEAYDDAARHSSGDTAQKAYYNKGNALLKDGDLEGSEEAYKEALRRNPNDEDARHNLAMTQKLIKAKKQGLKDTTGNFKKDPNGKYLMKDSAGNINVKDPNDPKNGKKDPNGENGTKQQPLDPKKQAMSADEAKKVMSALRDSEQKTRQRMNQTGSESIYKPSRDKDW